jgi:hypothetical protein
MLSMNLDVLVLAILVAEDIQYLSLGVHEE